MKGLLQTLAKPWRGWKNLGTVPLALFLALCWTGISNAYTYNRIIGNTMLNYQINDYFSFMGRIGLSENHGDYNNRTAFSTVGANNQYGSFYTKQNRRYELNMDFLLTCCSTDNHQ